MSARRSSQRGDASPFPGGPLSVCRGNPIWPADETGKAVFLTGSHTWAAFQERGIEGRTPDFDFEQYLDMMASCGHNFLRLWTWEHARGMQFVSSRTPIRYTPLPWRRTGPGTAADGLAKFDLRKFDPEYFERLRRRVTAAGRRGIYVSVMFFQGFSLRKSSGEYGVFDDAVGNAWLGHPFHRANNINGIHGESDGSNTGHEVHTLADPEVTRLQEAFVRKVIDTLADLDYVIWEVSNESEVASVPFQYHVVRYVHDYEQAKGYPRRMVGMSGSPIEAEALLAGPADWVSPPMSMDDPPAADGGKIVILDTDHCGPNRFEPILPWKALTRGCGFCAMDPWRDVRCHSPATPVPEWDDLRRSMGAACAASQRVNLNAMRPAGERCSTGFCLADPQGTGFLALRPDGGDDLLIRRTLAAQAYRIEWIHTISGRVVKRDSAESDAAGHLTLAAPHGGPLALIATL